MTEQGVFVWATKWFAKTTAVTVTPATITVVTSATVTVVIAVKVTVRSRNVFLEPPKPATDYRYQPANSPLSLLTVTPGSRLILKLPSQLFIAVTVTSARTFSRCTNMYPDCTKISPHVQAYVHMHYQIANIYSKKSLLYDRWHLTQHCVIVSHTCMHTCIHIHTHTDAASRIHQKAYNSNIHISHIHTYKSLTQPSIHVYVHTFTRAYKHKYIHTKTNE